MHGRTRCRCRWSLSARGSRLGRCGRGLVSVVVAVSVIVVVGRHDDTEVETM